MGKESRRTSKKNQSRKRPARSEFVYDKHICYQQSVQNTEHEVQFIHRVYRRLAGRPALRLREDFCGTALLSCDWVEYRKDREAVGVDLDSKVLAWGQKHNVLQLPETSRSRIRLVHGDVRDAAEGLFDVVTAYNYSYFVFKTRAEMRAYFALVHSALAQDGVFFLDAYGGYEAQTPMTEQRAVPLGKEKFTYIWEQALFNPIDNHVVNYIHFRSPDGTLHKRAFTYDWRLWQLVELREILAEVGFARIETYWETEDEEGNPTGTFRKATRAEPDPGWNAYLVASKRS
ncbi:MAG: class I SAM-dependent methyltransferase [Myxococcota bacterium]